MLTRLAVVIRTTSITAHLRLLACPDEDAHQAISPCLFAQRRVGLEIITGAHNVVCWIIGPGNLCVFCTVTCEIASYLSVGTILNHIDLTRVRPVLPSVWGHPKRSCPCPLATNLVHIKIKLLKIVHVELASIHL